MNRRQMLISGFTASGIALATTREVQAASEPNYRLWGGDYKVFPSSMIPVVRLDESAGTARDYGEDVLVSSYVSPLFVWTGKTGVGPWWGFFNGELKAYAEFRDVRNGKIFRIYKGDKIEVRFYNDSSVQVQFQCLSCGTDRFKVIIGSERRPDGRLLSDAACHCHRTGGRDEGGSFVYAPTHLNGVRVFSISWSWSPEPTIWGQGW